MEPTINLSLHAWNAQNTNFNKLLTDLTDDQLNKEIAAGKNTGTYLLGHLVAVSDALLPLLGFGERLFPALENIFIKNPDKSGLEKPSIAELKQHLAEVNTKLNAHIEATAPADWLQKHTAVTTEAFEKEPHRNKLNVLISRTTHMAYHLGQMVLLK